MVRFQIVENVIENNLYNEIQDCKRLAKAAIEAMRPNNSYEDHLIVNKYIDSIFVEYDEYISNMEGFIKKFGKVSLAAK